jgi:SAM-dependent methyltransferase
MIGAGDHYDQLAETYNRWMGEDFCRRVLPAIERLFLSRITETGLPGAGKEYCILDLCCGSGQMARALTERGFRVTGVDVSEQMLRLARQNVPAGEFIRADARSFRLPPIFHGALSTFNSVAHLGGVDELETVFRNLWTVLLPGAPFLFDLNLEEAYTTKWRGCFSFVTEQQACIVRPSYDSTRRLGRNDITLFQAGPEGGNQTWTRADFYIEQKCHLPGEVHAALQAAGFSHIEVYDGQRDLGIAGEWGRAFFLSTRM